MVSIAPSHTGITGSNLTDSQFHIQLYNIPFSLLHYIFCIFAYILLYSKLCITVQYYTVKHFVKGILWQFDKLVLKVPSGRDEKDGIGHFPELGSSWPGEAKTWPKIALRVGGRAEKYCVGGRAAGRYWAARPPTQNIPPVLQHVALFLATF